MLTVFIIFIGLSIVASLLVILACILSARISREENVPETYDDWEPVDVPTESYSWKTKNI